MYLSVHLLLLRHPFQSHIHPLWPHQSEGLSRPDLVTPAMSLFQDDQCFESDDPVTEVFLPLKTSGAFAAVASTVLPEELSTGSVKKSQ